MCEGLEPQDLGCVSADMVLSARDGLVPAGDPDAHLHSWIVSSAQPRQSRHMQQGHIRLLMQACVLKTCGFTSSLLLLQALQTVFFVSFFLFLFLGLLE